MPGEIEEILNWDQHAVEQYLIKNKIYGCKAAIIKNHVDGRAFLQLDHESLAKWGVSTIQQSRILALVSGLGSERYRKQISSSTSTKKPPSAKISMPNNPMPFAENRAFPPIATVKPNLTSTYRQNTNPTSSSKRDETKTSSVSVSTAPTLPPKPSHLRPAARAGAVSKPIPRQYSPEENYLTPMSKSDSIPSLSHRSEDPPEENYLTPMSKSDSIPSLSHRPAHLVDTDHHSIDSFTSDEDLAGDETSNNGDQDENYEDPDECQPGSTKQFLTSMPGRGDDKSKHTSGELHSTPPLPPTRNKGPSHSSSQSSLASESASIPGPVRSNFPPQQAERTFWKSSQSSLAESLPSNPPPPVPISLRSNPSLPVKPNPIQGSASVRRQANELQRASPAPSGATNDRSSNDSEAHIQPWYFNVERRQAESCLSSCRDGTFLVRPSKHGGKDSPFTLSLQYNGRIFHVLIRRRPDGKLALGTEKLGEDSFASITALVQHHQTEPMHLHAGSRIAGTTRLTQWPENIFDRV